MRRLAALLLILCLVFCLLPTMSAASGISVCFIAANDNLLELSYQPYWQGSTIYVPYTVFVNFKIYNSFHQSSNTASLYSSTKQLYFNLDSGETYDGNGTYYNVTPISRGGQVYVPLDFICGQYGLNWSYINSSNSFIDVCRISDANVILSNDQFLTAAKPLMETRYNAYVSSNGGSVDWGGGGGSSTHSGSSGVSHGGGGNEADWPSQGSIGNVMDHLIAQGKTREAILVCMNNSVYQWDFGKIARNCEERIIPFLEKLFPISKDTKDRAFCGLSMGSMTTLYMYMHRSHVYDYFGAFSGGIAPGHEQFTLEDPHLKDVTLMIGSAEEDIAYNEREIGVPPTIRALEAKGLPYIPYFVTGSHDWFCWPQMFQHFAEAVLWKKENL